MREKPKSTEIRINKFISQSGICSRREADNLIKKGLVFINGVKCDQLGKKISSKDKIEIKGKEIKPEKKINGHNLLKILLKDYAEAKTTKNYKKVDLLRQRLAEEGIIINDMKDFVGWAYDE